LRAIVNEITDTLWEDFQVRPRRVEGGAGAAWQVLDFFDVIVHVMRDEVREKYNLESLWGDAPRTSAKRGRKRAGSKNAPAQPTESRASNNCFGLLAALDRNIGGGFGHIIHDASKIFQTC